MSKRNFLFLISLSEENANFGKTVLDNIKRKIDATSAPAWIDSRGVGIFISTDLQPQEIWSRAAPDLKTTEERQTFRDALLLELGYNHLGHSESRAMAWLNSHAKK